jgi:hypothetical protein
MTPTISSEAQEIIQTIYDIIESNSGVGALTANLLGQPFPETKPKTEAGHAADWDEIKHLTAKLTRPEEIHALAVNYNWDNDTDELIRLILDHPACDKGTALMLYYMAEPLYYYQKYQDIDDVMKNKESDWEVDSFRLIKYIEEKIKANNFKTAMFSYDAQKELRQNSLFNPHPKNPNYIKEIAERIPKECAVTVEGIYPSE